MLEKSQKFGTVLIVGPRLKKFLAAGVGESLLWRERYPGQEQASRDGRGEFQNTREWIETASLEGVFDLWCRGQNLIDYARILLDVTKAFRRIFEER